MRRDLYAMDVDRKRNCYSYEGFGYLTRNYKNQDIVGSERRIEYGDNLNIRNNLKEEESLVILD